MGDCIYSEVVKARDRRYFLDVYAHNTAMRLSVKESRIANGQRQSSTVQVWESDLVPFVVALLRCANWFESNDLHKAVEDLRAECAE